MNSAWAAFYFCNYIVSPALLCRSFSLSGLDSSYQLIENYEKGAGCESLKFIYFILCLHVYLLHVCVCVKVRVGCQCFSLFLLTLIDLRQGPSLTLALTVPVTLSGQ